MGVIYYAHCNKVLQKLSLHIAQFLFSIQIEGELFVYEEHVFQNSIFEMKFFFETKLNE